MSPRSVWEEQGWAAVCFSLTAMVTISCFFQEDSDPPISESLSIENALWAGTVIASGESLGGHWEVSHRVFFLQFLPEQSWLPVPLPTPYLGEALWLGSLLVFALKNSFQSP